MHYGHAELLAGSCTRSPNLQSSVPYPIIYHLHRTAILVGAGELFLHRPLLAGKSHAVAPAALGREGEGAAASLLGVCLGHLGSSFGHRDFSFQMQALVACRLESHTIGNTGHQVAALREELQFGLRRSLIDLRLTAKRTKRHLVEKVARFLGFVKDRKDAAVKLLVVAIVFLRHTVVVEPLLRDFVVGMLRDAPVQLPSRIGPQLIVAAVKRVLQHKGAVHLPVLQFQLLTLHEVTVLIQQLSIEDTAQATWRPCVAAAHIGLVVDGVAQEIAGVVHVDEHLFLRDGLTELLQTVGPTFQCRWNLLGKSTLGN